jgi:hypothetical protein
MKVSASTAVTPLEGTAAITLRCVPGVDATHLKLLTRLCFTVRKVDG